MTLASRLRLPLALPSGLIDLDRHGQGFRAAAVVRKVTGDLAAKGVAVADAQLRMKMDELMALAAAQVNAGT